MLRVADGSIRQPLLSFFIRLRRSGTYTTVSMAPNIGGFSWHQRQRMLSLAKAQLLVHLPSLQGRNGWRLRVYGP